MSYLGAPATTLQRWIFVVWPAFLAACVLEAVVFALVDPAQLHWPGPLAETSRKTTYTLAFFCFWLISAGCSGLALWLASPVKSDPP
jgi:hypothetical protein